MKGLKSYFEEFHNVRYTAEAIESAVDLAVRHITDRKLPDKAIDVIDEAGAYQKLLPLKKGKKATKKTVGIKDIEMVISKIARVPTKTVSRDDTKVLKSLGDDLKRVVFGQDAAVEKVTSAVKLARGRPARAQ